MARLTPRAVRTLKRAEEIAADLGHSYLGTEHLLLGLLEEPKGLACQVLDELGVADQARDKVMRRISTSEYGTGSGELNLEMPSSE